MGHSPWPAMPRACLRPRKALRFMMFTTESTRLQQTSLPHIDRRLIAVGLVAGAAVGAWAGSRMRELADHDGTTGLIDWEQARSIAINMNRGNTLTAVERADLTAYYQVLGERCVPIVTAYMGSQLPAELSQTFAFDRVDWINANLDAFKVMFAPIEAMATSPERSQSVGAAIWGGLNRTVISGEVGLLLGYLARRVLGQYDLALLGREPVTGGKLYYVEPNIQYIERALGMPKDEFRMWLALHETTHAFEFEAHPWVRTHFNGLLERYFEYFKRDVDQLKQGMRGIKIIVERARSRERSDGSWIEALMLPEQKVLFNEVQALMCVVEGYSNHIMNAVGRDLLPSFESIAERFEQRRRRRGMSEQLFARLTGMDIKMEQYRLGELFIDQIAEARSHDAVKRIWEGPANLPTMDEIREPARWMARVLDSAVDPASTGPAIMADDAATVPSAEASPQSADA
jgi:coenzyme F420 biosynthesis associated uncharacterized protein